MAEQDDAADKSHYPTQKKLDNARKKGEVARSNEVNVALSYCGIWVLLAVLGGISVSSFGATLQIGLFNALGREPSLHFSLGLFAPLLLGAGQFFGLMAIVPAALIVLALLEQQTLLFTSSKVKPKASRISIPKNVKNKFGRGGLFEFAKSFVKILGFLLCLGLFLNANFDTIVGASAASEGGAILVLLYLVTSFLSLAVLIATVIAIIDYGWQI